MPRREKQNLTTRTGRHEKENFFSSCLCGENSSRLFSRLRAFAFSLSQDHKWASQDAQIKNPGTRKASGAQGRVGCLVSGKPMGEKIGFPDKFHRDAHCYASTCISTINIHEMGKSCRRGSKFFGRSAVLNQLFDSAGCVAAKSACLKIRITCEAG
jgi:hypothetical protein